MRCAVVVPPIEDFYYTPHRGSFLGAHIVARILKSLGYLVDLYIFPNTKKPRIIQIPDELRYLKDFIIDGEVGPFSYFTTYKRFGPDYKKAAELILLNSPDLVFISCFAFCYTKSTIRVAEEITKKDKNIKIIVGGAGVSVFPEYFENTGLFYSVLTKEAEIAIPEFFGRDVRFDLIPSVVNTKNTKRVSYFSTYLTRGCPKNCGFCSVALVHGRKLREVDSNLLMDILPDEDNSKIFLFNFEDDNVLLKKESFFEVLQKIKSRYSKVLFSCENGIDYRELDIDTLQTMINLGFRQFNLSIVNVNKRILLEQKRTFLRDKFIELVDYLKEQDIETIVYFIAGFRGESWKDSIKNLIFLAQLGERVRVGLSVFYPVPGILGFEEKGFFLDKSPYLLCSSSAYPWNNSLTTQDFITLFRLARVINFLKRPIIENESYYVVKKIIREKRLYTFVKNIPYPVEVKNYNRDMVKELFDNLKITLKK